MFHTENNDYVTNLSVVAGLNVCSCSSIFLVRNFKLFDKPVFCLIFGLNSDLKFIRLFNSRYAPAKVSLDYTQLRLRRAWNNLRDTSAN